MNSLIVIALCLFAVAATAPMDDEMKAKMMELAKKCAQETGASENELANMKEKKEMPTSHEGKCMLSCIQQAIGFQDANGIFIQAAVAEKILKMKPEYADKVGPVIDKCNAEVKVGSDHCETSVAMLACAMKACQEMGVPLPM